MSAEAARDLEGPGLERVSERDVHALLRHAAARDRTQLTGLVLPAEAVPAQSTCVWAHRMYVAYSGAK